jgi:hypothetical protein
VSSLDVKGHGGVELTIDSDISSHGSSEFAYFLERRTFEKESGISNEIGSSRMIPFLAKRPRQNLDSSFVMSALQSD